MPAPKPAPQLQHRARVGQARRSPPDVVDPAAVLGDQRPQRRAWSGSPRRSAARRSTTGSGGPRHRLGLVATSTSTTPLATCTSSGPMSSGANTPRPPPSIMAGPPMPMLEPRVAMTTSLQPRMAALPAKHRPEVIPTSGTSPLSRPHRWKAMVSSPDTPGASVSPGRPPPPSAKNTTGRRWRSITSNSRSFLRWFWKPLGAGQHRVVVGQDGGGPAVDRADAGHQAVGRRPGDQVVDDRRRRWAAMASGAVLDQRAGVEQVGDVLPGGALPGAPAAAPPRSGRARRGPRRAARPPRPGRPGRPGAALGPLAAARAAAGAAGLRATAAGATAELAPGTVSPTAPDLGTHRAGATRPRWRTPSSSTRRDGDPHRRGAPGAPVGDGVPAQRETRHRSPADGQRRRRRPPDRWISPLGETRGRRRRRPGCLERATSHGRRRFAMNELTSRATPTSRSTEWPPRCTASSSPAGHGGQGRPLHRAEDPRGPGDPPGVLAGDPPTCWPPACRVATAAGPAPSMHSAAPSRAAGIHGSACSARARRDPVVPQHTWTTSSWTRLLTTTDRADAGWTASTPATRAGGLGTSRAPPEAA